MGNWDSHVSGHKRIYQGICSNCKHKWCNHNRFGCNKFNCLCKQKNYPLKMIANWNDETRSIMHRKRKHEF